MIPEIKNIQNGVPLDRSDMALLGAFACVDCHHFKRCQVLFMCDPENRECDFYPIRFHLKVT
jgi:hypothetical protein